MKRILKFVSFSLILCLFFSACRTGVDFGDQLQIFFFDVGQGDAILFRTSAGDVLIDSGPESAEELLLLRLSDLGVQKLDLLILTHPDEDHSGGADGILRNFEVAQIWCNGITGQNDSYLQFLAVAEEQRKTPIMVQAGKLATVGGVAFAVLSPLLPEEGNNGSLLIKASFGDTSVLLMGDIEATREEILLNTYPKIQLKADILKVGHHGSATSTTKELLSAVDPTYGVISCGEGNSYGHPYGVPLAALEEAGVEILRTDRMEEIAFVSDGKTVELLP